MKPGVNISPAIYLEVENVWRVPVPCCVDVALRGGDGDEVAVRERDLDDAVAELQRLPSVVRHVAEGDRLAA